MRKHKIQASLSMCLILSVTAIFVIHVLAAPSVTDQGARGDTATQTDTPEVVATTITAEAYTADECPEPATLSIIECIPDVSDIEETFISDEAYVACIKYAEEYNLSPELLMAMIERESVGDPNAYNGTDSGLMQIAEKWHYDRMERLNVTDLFDTDQNIHTGADFLAELFERYGDTYFVLMVYNMGYDKADRLYSRGKISNYAMEIVARADELTLLHMYGGAE